MSLIKQLWIAIALVMTLAFGGSLVVSVLSARHYLEQQLQVKNLDNATSLALSLTQLDKDPVTVELQVAAQFDVGHYRFIRVTSPTGEVLTEKVYEGRLEGAPQWFADLIPIRVQPGQALIQDGWKQFGTISLASHEQYAYKSLWDGTLELLLWFVAGSLFTGVAGTFAVRVITRPLGEVVGQAQAIAERRFLTVSEPTTPELRAVSRAMNDMVGRLKAMFAEESARLEALRNRVNRDPVTGIANREYFLSHLREILTGEQFGSTGSLVLVRLAYLNELNAKLGHQRADQLLKQLGQVLFDSGNDHPGQRAGRVKGGEFAVMCPTFDSPTAAAQDIHGRLLRDWLPHWEAEFPDLFHLAAVPYVRNQGVGDLLTRADQALAQAQGKGPNSWHAVEDGGNKLSMPAEQWRTLLTEAVQGGQLSLAFFPVVRGDRALPLHQEGVIRLQMDTAGQLLSAGDFMPMAANLNLTAPIDLGVVKLAIDHLRQVAGDVAVNLSAETISDFGFRNRLVQLLQGYPDLCRRLLFEVPEYGVFKQFDAFRDLARSLKALGCRVGIEYFGQRFAETAQLAGLGLDYIKVHPSYVRGISTNAGNQEFLKGLCNMAHALGITVIALGVENPTDLPLLAQLGFDGATGPGVR
ncbi:EAL domain-containing protein [Aquabacterium sp. A08]|uniref:bifunctional diguanylate cyclase/phosphodiesterase n=1 Tax=Aquabacterium sp. A08 TaxID=2718532 RepID=UPI00141F2428|nr:EAL domain-containing protein [Aquabacterium sp. A08]NIC42717.1 EAL domain-containing protein [Aquabacterium sp. A08]